MSDVVIPEDVVMDVAQLVNLRLQRHIKHGATVDPDVSRAILRKAAPALIAANIREQIREAEKRGAQELQRRIDVVLAWHNPVESEYRDAGGNVTRTVTECAHCSTLADDGIDWPCATASALGATSGEVAR